MKLYELTDQIQFLRGDTELEEDEFQKALDEIHEQFQDKVENIGKFFLTLQADVTAIKSEEERLQSRRQSIERKAGWLKSYLLQEMTAVGIERVQRGILTVSIRTNPPSANVIDREAIPTEFRRIIPWEPDKKQIIDHFKTTGEVVAGIEIIKDKKSIQIK